MFTIIHNRKMEHKPRHFLKSRFRKDWEEVTKQEWIEVERECGFRPKMSSDDPRYMDTYATAGFTSGFVSGTITHDGSKPESGL